MGQDGGGTPDPTSVAGKGSPAMSPGDPTQGPAGVPAGFNGANVAASSGPQLGMMRDQMGGMGSSPQGAPDPLGQLIAELVQLFTGGGGGPGAAQPPQSPMSGPPT